MFCRNCGNELNENAAICVKCGVAVGNGDSFCPNCGAETNAIAEVCLKCGVSLKKKATAETGKISTKSKLVAGLLGIFLGGLGIHNFYLGKASRGAIQIIVSLVTCGAGGIWGFIEGILILCGQIKTDGTGAELVN